MSIIADSIYYTFKASQKSKCFVRVYFDGQDWVHKWKDAAYVFTKPLKRPLLECTVSIPLFTFAYRPTNGNIIFDVGAGAGTELSAFSKMAGKDGHVYAIEADPVAVRCLKKQKEILGLDNVTIINCAIGDMEGTAYLSQDEAGAITNMLMEKPANNSIEVPITTLDKLIEKYDIKSIDYMKMNIEGAEIPALRAFTQHPKMVKHWCISCHDFMGTEEGKTFDFVNHWLSNTQGLQVSRHPDVPGAPWMGYYLYA
ncbi:MAG: FkbM family methyltransferase [Rhodocyclales bacterium]|nr:FkbM family methyltransferase [Rhodocyclales bacterium]